jgi:hypothetical protein
MVNYVVHTLPALPTFLATKAVNAYVDDLRGLSDNPTPRGGPFLIGANTGPPNRYKTPPLSAKKPAGYGIGLDRMLNGRTSGTRS